jgi:DNA-binding FrmR family transcriptional regulator
MITDLKKRALHRTKIIQGQLKGVEKMVADEEYCMDIITQTLAIQKSLSSLNKLLIENHLKTHVSSDLMSGDAKRKTDALNELLAIYELNNVRGRQ